VYFPSKCIKVRLAAGIRPELFTALAKARRAGLRRMDLCQRGKERGLKEREWNRKERERRGKEKGGGNSGKGGKRMNPHCDALLAKMR